MTSSGVTRAHKPEYRPAGCVAGRLQPWTLISACDSPRSTESAAAIAGMTMGPRRRRWTVGTEQRSTDAHAVEIGRRYQRRDSQIHRAFADLFRSDHVRTGRPLSPGSWSYVSRNPLNHINIFQLTLNSNPAGESKCATSRAHHVHPSALIYI